jgi:hypothetical protein
MSLKNYRRTRRGTSIYFFPHNELPTEEPLEAHVFIMFRSMRSCATNTSLLASTNP